MSVVRGMRGVGGVCEMYVFGWERRGWRGGECVRGLGLGFSNPVGTGVTLDVCLWFGSGGEGGVGGKWVGSLDQGLEWCYVCVRCESG